MKKVILLAHLLWLPFISFAQSSVQELNSLAQKSIGGLWAIGSERTDYQMKEPFKGQTITSVSITSVSQYHSLTMTVNGKEYLIHMPYNVYNGEWRYTGAYDGRYIHEGDMRVVTISRNRAYGDNPIVYPTTYLIGIKFPRESDAEAFVNALNSLQASSYLENLSWYEYVTTTEKYKDYSSKKMFDLLSSELTKNTIRSEQAHNDEDYAKTTINSITYNDGNLIITYRDSHSASYMAPYFKSGTYKVTIPLMHSVINDRHMYTTCICFFSNFSDCDGITITRNGETDYVEDFLFYAPEPICKRIVREIKQFRNKVKDEGFTGKYSYSRGKPANSNAKSSSNNSTNDNNSILGKYVQ